jgi:hypothetical protein
VSYLSVTCGRSVSFCGYTCPCLSNKFYLLGLLCTNNNNNRNNPQALGAWISFPPPPFSLLSPLFSNFHINHSFFKIFIIIRFFFISCTKFWRKKFIPVLKLKLDLRTCYMSDQKKKIENREGGYTVLPLSVCLSVLPSKIFFVAFFSATIDSLGKNKMVLP